MTVATCKYEFIMSDYKFWENIGLEKVCASVEACRHSFSINKPWSKATQFVCVCSHLTITPRRIEACWRNLQFKWRMLNSRVLQQAKTLILDLISVIFREPKLMVIMKNVCIFLMSCYPIYRPGLQCNPTPNFFCSRCLQRMEKNIVGHRALRIYWLSSKQVWAHFSSHTR